MDRMVVGMTCVGSLVSQGVIKSLKDCDLAGRTRLIGFEYFPGTVGSYWVERTHLLPDILKPGVSWEEYVQALCGRIREEGIQILFPGMDFELPLLAAYRDRIQAETGCVVVVSRPEVVAIAEDKFHTYRFLEEQGLERPRTWLPSEAGQVEFPVVVKPRRGARSRGLSVVLRREDLDQALAGAEDPVIQEEVGTREDEYTCAVLYLDGAVRSRVCMRRYLRDGNTAAAFHSPDTPPAVHAYVDELARRLEPFGPCNFQLRLDRAGRPKLFEINARFSGTTYMRTLFGCNEVEYVVKRLLGLPLPVMTPRYGKVLRYFEELYVPEGA